MSSAVYSNFFSPQTISILFCLQQLARELSEPDSESEIIKFLLSKILSLNEVKVQINTNQAFQAQLLSVTNNYDFLQKYQAAISQVDSFNIFYGKVSDILKNLRSIRTNKLQQSNLIDFFVRRLYIYFEKLDFKEIISVFECFQHYMEGVEKQPKQNQFMLAKSIEEVRFNLENYSFKTNPEEMNAAISQLELQDHTYKTSYLKGISLAQQGSSVQSSHFLRRYFDKNLMNLFPDRVESGGNNKINHCILGVAYSDLQLGHLDQCLQSISQGLRISQNNSDQQSINNCIIYLYHVAEKLGKYRQQILLAGHAITHSLNQSNLTLTLYSCLSCSLFEKRYDVSDSSLSLLNTRQVSWKDALHFAKKKLHSHFENSCRNIFHSYRNLLIPTLIHKLAILTHIPSLKGLLINPYYERKQLTQLTVYKQFIHQNQISELIKKGKVYLGTGQKILLSTVLSEINNRKLKCNPEQIIKIWKFENQIKYRQCSYMQCLAETQELIIYAKKNGFIKNQYVDSLRLVSDLLLNNGLMFDSLVKIEEALKVSVQHKLEIQQLSCLIMKAYILISMDLTEQAIEILKQIEENGDLSKLSNQSLRKFYEAKLLLNKNLLVRFSQIEPICLNLSENIYQLYQNIIRICLSEKDISQTRSWLLEILNYVQKHPVYMKIASKIQKSLKYCDHVTQILKNSNEQTSNDQQIAIKIMEKIRRICQF